MSINMSANYDVAIIGGGIGGLACAYELKRQNKDINIIIIEKGNKLEDRKCPASKNNKCVKCKICNITTGIAAYNAKKDIGLLLESARFKYDSRWYSIENIYNSLIEKDSFTNKPRGFLLIEKKEKEGKKLK